MQDPTVTFLQIIEPASRPTSRRRNASEALLRAARRLLDAGDPEDVGLREIARRTGVSAAAAYRHFVDKDDLMATVATEGFHELAAALRAASDEPDPTVGTGLAYVDFARMNRGLFRLMFGPLLAGREKFPALSKAADEAFGVHRAIGFRGLPIAAARGCDGEGCSGRHPWPLVPADRQCPVGPGRETSRAGDSRKRHAPSKRDPGAGLTVDAG